MSKKNIGLWLLGFGLLAAPALALAQSPDVQVRITALEAQVQQLLAEIAALQGGTQSPCVDLSRNLTLGSRGSAVSSLQHYLIAKDYLDPTYATGYYGFLTASAVGKLQVAFGIVSSQNDPAYGIAGPKTRAAISCGGIAPPRPNSDLSAAPASGPAPLSVSFSGTGLTGGSQYIIDYGDGSNSGPLTAIDVCMHLSDGSGGCPRVSANHTYAHSGTYTASLENYIACEWSTPRCLIATQPLGSVTITVGSGGIGTLSITGLDAPASLSLGETGTWTVHATGSGTLHYSVRWGDETAMATANAGEAVQTSATFTHVYNVAGTFTPAFTVSDDSGDTETTSATVVALASATDADFTATPASGPAPLAVNFSAMVSTYGAEYLVDFGDGTTGPLRTRASLQACPLNGNCVSGSASHTYVSPGTYTASLSDGTGRLLGSATITVSASS